MTFADHARRELELTGLTETDPEMADCLVKTCEAFAAYGHSGGSHGWAVETLTRLLNFRPLTPLTNDPAEWMLVGMGSADGRNCWQSRRQSDAFSEDGGQTYYLLDEDVDGVRPLHRALTRDEVKMLAQADADTELDAAQDTVVEAIERAGYRAVVEDLTVPAGDSEARQPDHYPGRGGW